MKVVYVSGPIRSKWGRLGRWLNLWRGRRAAIQLWKAGFAVICPHLNSVTLRCSVDEDKLIDGDCYIVPKCDFIVMIGGWKTSKGAVREYETAGMVDLPIYLSTESAIAYEYE